MTTFKNRNFTKRDYETTNIVACVAEAAPSSQDDLWVPADDEILDGLTHIFTQGGVRFYGYL